MRALARSVRPLVVLTLLVAAAWFTGADTRDAFAGADTRDAFVGRCSVGAMTFGPTPSYNVGYAASLAVNGDQDDRCESGALSGLADKQ